MPHAGRGSQHVAAGAHINLPGPVLGPVAVASAGPDSRTGRAGEIDYPHPQNLPGPDASTRLAGRASHFRAGEIHHPRHERLADVKADTANWLRYDDYWKFWAALWQDRTEAYAVWEAGFARLESVRWLELAA
jgi:hypothetical protein